MSAAYDALVVGAGPAGSATALRLAEAGWSVLVVERSRFPRGKVCGEYLGGAGHPLLERFGVAGAVRAEAGPAVTHVGLFAGEAIVSAPLPRPPLGYGRALGRDRLDALLLERARASGAHVRQPATVVAIERDDGRRLVTVRDLGARADHRIAARVVVRANGSFGPDADPLAAAGGARAATRTPAPHDLFGFKARFLSSRLRPGLMPLLAFRGGYGGMVRTDADRVSLSCCVRRDALARVRATSSGEAGLAVEAHVRDACRGVREALAGAEREGPWLAAGPIHPGVRASDEPGVFRVGNAAGEAHPAVAEGIGMALHGADLLAAHLIEWRRAGGKESDLERVGGAYARDWRRALRGRVRVASLVARWAARPAAVAASLPFLRAFPAALTVGARFTGKAGPFRARVRGRPTQEARA